MRFIDEKLENYCIEHSSQPSSVCKELAEYTKKNISKSQMLIGPMEASVLGFLIRSISAKRIVEFGTYTGYSALAMAEYLPDDGKLYTLDVNEETTQIAKGFWAKSPHGKKIELLLGSAIETISSIKAPIDFVFIDADKENYLNYLEAVLPKLSDRGVIVADNTLWSARVLESEPESESTKSLKAFNQWVHDSDLQSCLLPIRDGMHLIRKNG